MVKLLDAKKVEVQEIIADFGGILSNINAVLSDHEQRLQLMEGLNLKIELELLRSRILMVTDKEKQTSALQTFTKLCDVLSISDLESTQS